MTTIHFHYTDSYNNPSRGSLAFMPHRRHAANETEILPKPFTIPLLNGEVSVNLQPNSSSWVWIITEYFEGVSKSFYTTVPDRDGVMEHTELVHISPSSLPAPYDAVEPAWWAEMRQYKTTVSDTLLQSGEALAEAQAAIETGRESIERTQHNASVAGAYADESRQSSYDAREYRDEAEQWRNEAQEQADRAATGPESAAARAEGAADRAETSETRARDSEDEARASAADARASETTATGAASTATERASDARNEANRAESEANRAKGYADELMDGPREYVDQALQARDDARDYATDAQTAVGEAANHVTAASGHVTSASQHAAQAETYANDASDSAALSNTYAEAAEGHLNTMQDRLSFARWRGSSSVLEEGSRSTISFTETDIFGDKFTKIDNSTIAVSSPGWYHVTSSIRFRAGHGSTILQNRITAASQSFEQSTSGSGTINTSAIVLMSDGDTIQTQAYADSGGELQDSGTLRNTMVVSYIGTSPD